MSRVLLCSALLASIAAGSALAADDDAKKSPQENPSAAKAKDAEKSKPWWMSDGSEKKPPKENPPAVRAKEPAVAKPDQPPPPLPPQLPPQLAPRYPATPYPPVPSQPGAAKSQPTGPYSPPLPAPFQPAPPSPYTQTYPVKVNPPKRLVYDLRNVPAVDVAETVSEFLKNEAASQPGMGMGGIGGNIGQRVVITPEPITNRLLVSGPPEQLEELAEMIKRLDAEPAMVSIDVLIAEVVIDDDSQKAAGELSSFKSTGKSLDAIVAELKKLGKLRMLARPSVSTLNNQPAFVQIGQRKPRVTGTSSSPRGQVNSVSMENVGLTLGVTPRINADGIVTMEIDVEQSRLGPAEEGTPIATSAEGETIRTPSVQTTQVQTTVSATSGQTVMLGGLVTRSEGQEPGERRLLMFVSPHVFRATQDK
jgi:hypothetical protein